jgi:hypothetical protein
MGSGRRPSLTGSAGGRPPDAEDVRPERIRLASRSASDRPARAPADDRRLRPELSPAADIGRGSVTRQRVAVHGGWFGAADVPAASDRASAYARVPPGPQGRPDVGNGDTATGYHRQSSARCPGLLLVGVGTSTRNPDPAYLITARPRPSRWTRSPATTRAPDAAVTADETIELTFLVAIQHLPPRQRGGAADARRARMVRRPAADTREQTVPAINSALQRARTAPSGSTRQGWALHRMPQAG